MNTLHSKTIKLNYTIHKYSSYSADYTPDNIMVNNPTNPFSRWFTDSTTPSQFVMLKLTEPAIVETIKFGRCIKAHVSDLKKFQVFGGMDENNLSILLSGGLKKDGGTPEVFKLRHKTREGLYLPIQYLKIVPLQSWGPAYNFSIWYVELQGRVDEDTINKAMDTVNLRKEEEAVRILLKHLRRRRYKDAFEALSRETGLQLEGPIQTRLWNALVENGDYKMAEQIFDEAVSEGELNWYMSWQPYTPVWRQVSPCSPQVEERLCCSDVPQPTNNVQNQDLFCMDRDPRPETAEGPANDAEVFDLCESSCGSSLCCLKPGPRGGHQLVVDPTTGTLYLFGGWNGTEDLDDLWSFCTTSERWTMLCRHSSLASGPSPRSCHKMVFDPVYRKLYTLGRYLDNAQRIPSNMNSDLYVYDVTTGCWSLICADTASVGGPKLVFDHQMCIDPDTQTLIVFGGRVLPANTEEAASPQYSGLYVYYIHTDTWQLLLPDKHSLEAPQPRVSHSMLFHPGRRSLYIFLGQRNKEHLVDMWWWELPTGRCAAMGQGSAPTPPPAAGFTQRATLDPETDEMFVLSGMSKEKDKRVYNTLWVFEMRRMSWICVYRNDTVSPNEPRPRFAHQLVYDPVRKIHYLFGGNPGNPASPRLRLDDLWSLQLNKMPLEKVQSDARAALREACYREMVTRPSQHHIALDYLRNDLREALDHSDPAQVSRFQKLATVLFAGSEPGERSTCGLTPQRTRALHRRRSNTQTPTEMANALGQVLGADDSSPYPMHPFEDFPEVSPETWDIGHDEEIEPPGPEWDARQARIKVYDYLCQYFRPSSVPPKADIMDLVAL